MKKFGRIMTSMVLGATCFSALAGCACGKGPEAESLTIKSGLQTVYYKGDPVSWDNLKLKVVYDDGTEEEIDSSKVTISEFNTNTLGTFDVKISYGGVEKVVKIKVTNNKDEVYNILSVENSKHFVQYNGALNPTENADFESVFIDREKNEQTVYKVGLDNEFIYNMNLTLLDDEDNYLEGVETTKTVTTVYVKDSLTGNYTKVEGNDVATYVEIDDEESSYQFKSAAKNKFFKLDVRPYYLKESQLANANNYTKSIEFQVVEGYNITNAKQLGILNNVNEVTDYTYSGDERTINLYEVWTKFLTEDNGIARADNTKAIILHNDINVTVDDIPAKLLAEATSETTRTGLGELTNQNAVYTDAQGKKWVLEENFSSDKCGGANVYCHQVAENETFTIHGNFFTLNVDLPTVDTTLLPNYGSTTSLFRFVSTYSGIENETTTLANNEAAITASSNTKVNINNLNSIGNAIRTDSTNEENNPDSAQMGGLIFVKAPAVTLNVTNSIVKAYLINFYMEQRLTTINLTNVKSYDAYQSIIYGYNGGNMTINDSFLERAGGPVILVATDDNNPSEKFITKIESNNSKLESWIEGKEPWFDVYGMSDLAAYLKAQNNQFHSVASSFVVEKETNDPDEPIARVVNAIIVNISNDKNTNSSTQPLVLFTIDGEVVADTSKYTASELDEQDPNYAVLDANQTLINTYAGFGAPVFTSDGAIMAIIPTGEDSFDIVNNINGEYNQQDWFNGIRADNGNNKKDYLTIHQGNMIMAIEYFEYVAPAE